MQPAVRTGTLFLGFAPPRGLASLCLRHCSTCVALALLAIPGAAENGGKEPRVPGFLSLRFQGVRGPDLASMLDLQGITIGTGSACEAAAGRPSPILRSLGLSEREAAESVRLSLGYRTTESDIDRLCQGIPATVSKLRALSGSSLR